MSSHLKYLGTLENGSSFSLDLILSIDSIKDRKYYCFSKEMYNYKQVITISNHFIIIIITIINIIINIIIIKDKTFKHSNMLIMAMTE